MEKEYPAFKLNAVSKDRLSMETKVFNSNEFEYYLHVRIPDDISKYFKCYQVDCIDDKNIDISDFENNIIFDNEKGRPWYRFISDTLKKSEGMHIYSMSFVNKITNDTYKLYFGYIIQDDFPEKNYDYMKGYRYSD